MGKLDYNSINFKNNDVDKMTGKFGEMPLPKINYSKTQEGVTKSKKLSIQGDKRSLTLNRTVSKGPKDWPLKGQEKTQVKSSSINYQGPKAKVRLGTKLEQGKYSDSRASKSQKIRTSDLSTKTDKKDFLASLRTNKIKSSTPKSGESKTKVTSGLISSIYSDGLKVQRQKTKTKSK